VPVLAAHSTEVCCCAFLWTAPTTSLLGPRQHTCGHDEAVAAGRPIFETTAWRELPHRSWHQCQRPARPDRPPDEQSYARGGRCANTTKSFALWIRVRTRSNRFTHAAMQLNEATQMRSCAISDA